LGLYGCRVVVAGKAQKNLASCSYHCDTGYAVTPHAEDSRRYFDDILTIVENEQVDYLFPMTEPASMILSENHALLPAHTILAAPDTEKLKTVFDKNAVFKLARQSGVPIPETVFVQDKKGIEQIAAQIKTYPVVIKPCMSRIPIRGGHFMETGIMYANSSKELTAKYRSQETLNYPSMIQEKIIGPGTGLFTLFDKDRHLALFSHKRLREKPPSGGVSVMCQSVPLDSEMVRASKILLSAVAWEGVAMVEFKRDIRDGKAKLMEINGRFWGSLQLAVSAGIDFPQLFLKYLMGDHFSKLHDRYRVGLKMKWLLGTLDHLLIRLRNKEMERNLPPGFPSRLKSITAFLKVREENTVYDVLQSKDWRPFGCELTQYLKELTP